MLDCTQIPTQSYFREYHLLKCFRTNWLVTEDSRSDILIWTYFRNNYEEQPLWVHTTC